MHPDGLRVNGGMLQLSDCESASRITRGCELRAVQSTAAVLVAVTSVRNTDEFIT